MSKSAPRFLAFWMALAILVPVLRAQDASRQPPLVDLGKHAFPAAGGLTNPVVNVSWNRFYDHAGLSSILLQLHQAFPKLTKLYSVGKSVQGRDLWCLEVTAGDGRKPGMYIDGNIHGNEVQGGEVVAYTAWYLLHQYGRLEKVTELLDHTVFYLLPTINPDGRDYWLEHAHNAHSSRTGVRPLDSDRDGVADEDDSDDLDGDGSITQMRKRDPTGRWKVHPQYPEFLMVEVAADEKGDFILLGSEGIDNDNDGRINEDPVGGYDMNRNWSWDWQPNFIQGGALEYPFCLPETRALAEFVIARPNIAAFQSYHNAGGMILRSPGREGGVIRPSDDRVLQLIAQRGEKMLPFYRSMVIWKDLYTVWGGEVDWLYGARGILGFTSELFTPRNLDKGATSPSREDEAAFLRHVMLQDGLTKWKEFDHPTYGKIEIGGTRKNWGRTPPAFLLEEECHRNMAFTLYHADQMPRLSVRPIEVEAVADGLFKVTVTVDNSRTIPTRSDQDVRNKITRPDVLSLEGPNVKVISAGIVSNRFFNRVEPVNRRPERVEIDSVPGMNDVRVQFIVTGNGRFKITFDSVRAAPLTQEQDLP